MSSSQPFVCLCLVSGALKSLLLTILGDFIAAFRGGDWPSVSLLHSVSPALFLHFKIISPKVTTVWGLCS